ncbi:MAG: hypothetical protein AAGM84_05685 [Pseudomonadota bacterium]
MSFSSNGAETIQFFQRFKDQVFRQKKQKDQARASLNWFSVDFRGVHKMSVPVAVVLAAEMHRWRLNSGAPLRADKPSRWQPHIRGMLDNLGVFSLLDIQLREHYAPQSELTLLTLKSGEKRDGAAVAELQTWIRSMGYAFEAKKSLFGALDEAMMNCLDHGYINIDGHEPRYPYAGHRWWATSCIDLRNGSLRFFVYDQGIGIPACIPTNDDFWGRIKARFPSLESDAARIEAAFEVGRTRTGQGERGKGLNKMWEAIKLANAGYIRVLSGKGDVTLTPTGVLKKIEHSAHIGGTLVEWSIPVEALQSNDS